MRRISKSVSELLGSEHAIPDLEVSSSSIDKYERQTNKTQARANIISHVATNHAASPIISGTAAKHVTWSSSAALPLST